MPRGDRTGPMGEGPKTGRGAGYCSGNDEPGYKSTGQGGFFRNQRENYNRGGNSNGDGRGNNSDRAPETGGRGRGLMKIFFETHIPRWIRNNENVNPKDELTLLKEQKESIENRINKLEK
ncbi:MAG: DUF5320 domain-containing protein [Nanoarchaeota archaeon]|nr:DUF5320 domain-containing protein [Nanoarchaeota archaeon]MBU1029709.1 DUF5320 domain-containing protein [Nanoarchaeota archaeon]MBU1850114.1 DUF5320 domain-containing protein [Nanoarchaeota archaeon]